MLTNNALLNCKYSFTKLLTKPEPRNQTSHLVVLNKRAQHGPSLFVILYLAFGYSDVRPRQLYDHQPV